MKLVHGKVGFINLSAAAVCTRHSFNEQLRLIVAEDALHAFYKARLIGERETLDIVNKGLPDTMEIY